MENQDKKKYSPPKIIFEINLETKAGSPLGGNESDVELFPGGGSDGVDVFPGGGG